MRRGHERCPECGAAQPDDAAFCPACGRSTGRLSLEPAEPADASTLSGDVKLGSPRRRWLAPVLVAGVAALIGAVAWAGARHEGGSASAPTSTVTPTTAPPASTTTAPTPPTTTFTRWQAAGPLLPGADGLVLYAGTNTNDVVRADLGSGAIERRSIPHWSGRGGPWAVLGRAGGAVVTQLAFDDQAPLLGVADGADGAVQEVASWHKSSAARGAQTIAPLIAPAAEPDEIWVWWSPQEGLMTLERVRLDGTVTAGPVPLPNGAVVVGADGPGAVLFSGPSGAYRAAVDQTAVQITRATVDPLIASSPAALLTERCSEEFVCDWGVVDRTTGQRRSLGEVPDAVSHFWGSKMSPDGRWFAMIVPTELENRVRVYDLTTGAVVLEQRTASNGGSPFGTGGPLFSTDSQWLVWLDSGDLVRAWRTGSSDPPRAISNSVLDGVQSVSLAPSRPPST